MSIKSLIISLLSIGSCLYATAENKFYIDDFSIAAGETKDIELCLTNDVAFTAFQADIYLPEGLTIYQEDGEYIFDLSDRKYRNHTIASAMQADGAIRILSYSTTSKEYSGTEGALVYCSVIADSDFSGTHQIEIKNIVFTQADETEYQLDATTTIVTGPTAEDTTTEIPLTIKDSECGQTIIYLEAGTSSKIKIEASPNWEINTVLCNETDVTAELDEDGIYSTPELTEATTISITYKDASTNIETMSVQNVKVYAHNGEISIIGLKPGDNVSVHDIDGKTLQSVIANNNNTININSLPINSIYIIKCNAMTYKVCL
ncbi:MAG: T9SS type A sorting domain-containing protein [Muribaculaceae bacterium]|nr:T9SS type A sorting domain-containing protein [Muribaculaceae bacterium]